MKNQNNILAGLLSTFNPRRLVTALFVPQTERRDRWLNLIVLAVLFLAGAVVWVYFFNRGNIAFMAHDWHEITGPRLAFLRDAVTRELFPLHISDNRTLGFVTDRYFAIPDAFVSPQIFLLHYMDIGHFVLFDVLFMYTLGFLGLLWLKRRFSLSLYAFSALFLLFNFNGNLLAHFGVGHFTWGGYFLLPWFVGLVFQLFDGDRSWTWVAKVAGILFVILLQGAYHQFIWSLILLALIGFFNWKLALPVLKAGLFSGLLAAVRLLPPALELGNFNNTYIAGYPSITTLLDSLVSYYPPGIRLKIGAMRFPLGYWELTMYIGLAGLAFLAIYGLVYWLRTRDGASYFKRLALPMVVISLLSFDRFYYLVRFIPIPLLNGERVSSRIIIIPFLFLLLLAVIGFQRWIGEQRVTIPRALMFLMALLVGAHDLMENLRAWNVFTASNAFVDQFAFTPGAYYVANHPDTPYILILSIGASISLASLVCLLILVWREKRNPAFEIA